jgi:hypothetical protein
MPAMRGNPAGAIYGTITVGALLAAESAQRETYAETIGAVALAMVLYWLAHAYAGSAAKRLRDEQALTAKGFVRALGHELPMLAGAAVPLLALVVFGVAGAKLSTAVKAGLWTSAVVIALIEIVAALRAEAKGRELAGQIAIGVGLGLLVLAINAVLH